jgi:ribosomal protein L44E
MTMSTVCVFPHCRGHHRHQAAVVHAGNARVADSSQQRRSRGQPGVVKWRTPAGPTYATTPTVYQGLTARVGYAGGGRDSAGS